MTTTKKATVRDRCHARGPFPAGDPRDLDGEELLRWEHRAVRDAYRVRLPATGMWALQLDLE